MFLADLNLFTGVKEWGDMGGCKKQHARGVAGCRQRLMWNRSPVSYDQI